MVAELTGIRGDGHARVDKTYNAARVSRILA